MIRSRFRVSTIASGRIDEIYVYTRDKWGEDQAEIYVRSLFDCFGRIADRDVIWRSIPAEFGIEGFYARHRHHYVYWRLLSDDVVGIVTVLHERMHQIDRFREDRGG